MPMNWSTFRTRTLTALVFVAVMLTGLLWSQWSFFILFTIIHFGCWYEYQKLMGIIQPDYLDITPFHRFGVMLAGWSLMLYATHNTNNFTGLSMASIGFWLGLILMLILPVVEILFSRQLNLKNIKTSLLGLLYISLSWALLTHLRFSDPVHGLIIPMGIIVSIWINDTMAYIVGSLIGKTPFSKISPKKTWEGTLGGIILAIVTVALLSRWIPQARIYDLTHWIMLAAISAIAGTAGDLLESKIKRMAGVKDSGALMPGHGGYLDRFDSLLIATPFVWLYVWLLM
jgi:phosphatidate cytidylyltransferase